jgi:hypothetical protein
VGLVVVVVVVVVDDDEDVDEEEAEGCRMVLSSMRSLTESFSRMKLGWISEKDPSNFKNRATYTTCVDGQQGGGRHCQCQW